VRINRKLIAASASFAFIAALCGPAFAAPPTVPVDQTVGQINILSGNGGGGANTAAAINNAFENASGNIGANIAAGDSNQQANSAYIDGPTSPAYNYTGTFLQGTLGAASVFSGLNKATVQNNAFRNASGNVGANIASGAQNMQDNALAVLENVTNVSDTVGQGQAFTISLASGGNNAEAMNNAFQNAKGNIGLNLAAGSLNQQSNSAVVMNLSSAADGDLGSVTSTIGQISAVTVNILSGGNNADVRNNAFQNASGNIGANVASGIGNQQANVLVVEP